MRIYEKQVVKVTSHGVGFKQGDVHVFNATEQIPAYIRGKLRVGMTVDTIDRRIFGIHDWARDAEATGNNIGVVTAISEITITFHHDGSTWSNGPAGITRRQFPSIAVGSVLRLTADSKYIQSVLVPGDVVHEWVGPLT